MNTAQTTRVMMRAVRRHSCAAAMVGAALLIALPGSGQSSGNNNNNNGGFSGTGQYSRRIPSSSRDIEERQLETMGMGTPVFYEKRLQMLNAAQHQAMVADTDKLVKLIGDLNAQINSSNANSLTPDQLRMVAEIEKLAHSVRDKMRMSVRNAVNDNVGPTPAFVPR